MSGFMFTQFVKNVAFAPSAVLGAAAEVLNPPSMVFGEHTNQHTITVSMMEYIVPKEALLGATKPEFFLILESGSNMRRGAKNERQRRHLDTVHTCR